MSITIGPPSVEELRPRITVIGVGGAGGNAIANMISAEIEGVDFIVANTDAQALNSSPAATRIQLGPDITQGLGAGSRPEVGRAAAEETAEDVERLLDGVNMVFIAAGMGGGTGTGAAPVIAEAARRKGVLTVGVVTKPFLFEGTRRMRAAEAGIEELQKHVDTLIVIPNQNLFLVAKAETTFKEAFQLADEVLQQGVRSITDLMVMPGLINLDFADIRSVMGEMGKAMMGTGEGEGPSRALEAAELAIANPLLDGVSMQGAKGVIISIIGGEDMKLLEVDEAANHIRELVDPEANIIWGSAFNPELEGKIRVSVIATGIEQSAEQAANAARPLDLSAARGPRTPVLPLAQEDELVEEPLAEDEFELTDEVIEEVAEEAAAPFEVEPELASEPEDGAEADAALAASIAASPVFTAYDEDETDEGEEEEWDEASEAAYASLTGGDLSAEDEDEWGEAAGEAAGEDTGAGEGDALELTAEAGLDDGPGTGSGGGSSIDDELLLDASRLVDEDAAAEAEFVERRRGLVAGGEAGEADAGAGDTGGTGGGAGGGGGAPGAGSTLFERMASLSRGAAKDEGDAEDDDEDDGPTFDIPRFLGRQNN